MKKREKLFNEVESVRVIAGYSKKSINSNDSEWDLDEAKLKVILNSVKYYEVAEGHGPVNALDNAIRKILVKAEFDRLIVDKGYSSQKKFKSLTQQELDDKTLEIAKKKVDTIKLESYSVVKLGGQDTASEVIITLRMVSEDKSVGSIVSSTNVLEASFKALTDCYQQLLK